MHDRDLLIRATLAKICHVDPAILEEPKIASQIHCPVKLGGLGLSSSGFISPAAYWASWCDALPGLTQRFPAFTEHFIATMAGVAANAADASMHSCHLNLQNAAELLMLEGYAEIPSWHGIIQGRTPPQEDGFRSSLVRAERVGSSMRRSLEEDACTDNTSSA